MQYTGFLITSLLRVLGDEVLVGIREVTRNVRCDGMVVKQQPLDLKKKKKKKQQPLSVHRLKAPIKTEYSKRATL
jgi:hypothetical protein